MSNQINDAVAQPLKRFFLIVANTEEQVKALAEARGFNGTVDLDEYIFDLKKGDLENNSFESWTSAIRHFRTHPTVTLHIISPFTLNLEGWKKCRDKIRPIHLLYLVDELWICTPEGYVNARDRNSTSPLTLEEVAALPKEYNYRG